MQNSTYTIEHKEPAGMQMQAKYNQTWHARISTADRLLLNKHQISHNTVIQLILTEITNEHTQF